MMLYFVLLLFLTHLNYVSLYPMENYENASVEKLTTFIQCPNTNEYLKWTYQPLAKNFKQHDAWSTDIVHNLFSPDQKAHQQAEIKCQKLLKVIDNDKKQLHKQEVNADRRRNIYICIPFIALFFQLYCNLYDPFSSFCIVEITQDCITKANVLEDAANAFARHAYQLHLIKSKVLTTLTKSKNSEQRQNFITRLIEKHNQKKEKHTKIINFLGQKPLLAKKND